MYKIVSKQPITTFVQHLNKKMCSFKLVILASDSRHKRSNDPSTSNPVVDEEQITPVSDFSLVAVSMLCFLQCSNTDDTKDIWPMKTRATYHHKLSSGTGT